MQRCTHGAGGCACCAPRRERRDGASRRPAVQGRVAPATGRGTEQRAERSAAPVRAPRARLAGRDGGHGRAPAARRTGKSLLVTGNTNSDRLETLSISGQLHRGDSIPAP